MLQGFVDIVEPMDTLLIIAERRYEMKKSRSCRMKPQPRKRLRPLMTTTKRGPSQGSGNWTGRSDNNGAMMSTRRSFTRGNFQPSNQNSSNFRESRPFERRDYPNNNNDRYNDYRATSQNQSDRDQSRNWGSNNKSSRSPSMSRQDSSFTDFRRLSRPSSPKPSVFNRFGNRDPSNNKSYDKKFPTSNDGNQPNVVRFTTTDDENNGILGLHPLNY